MNSIGSVDYSGMLNQSPENLKVSHQEFVGTHQQQIADIQEQVRKRESETVNETPESDSAKIKDEDSSPDSGHNSNSKRHEDDEESEEGEKRYIIAIDEDRGQHFDLSA